MTDQITTQEAVDEIIDLAGGHPATPGSTTYKFPSLAAADRCKRLLDALLPPSSTGEVFGPGWLVVGLYESKGA